MKKFENVDRWLLTIIFILTLFGTLMVLSTSVIMANQRYNAPYNFFIKQIIWTIIGGIGLYTLLHLNQKIIRNSVKYLFFIFTLVLIGLLIWGKEINGAKRWFNIGFITFQPAEFMKLIMILFLADYLDRKRSKLKTFSGFVKLLAIVGVPLILIMLQPDLGSVVILFVIIFSMLYLAGVKLKYIAFALMIGLLTVSFETMRFPYRRARVSSYIAKLNFQKSNLGAQEIKTTTQQDAATVAIMRGGWLGTGPGNSRLKLFYLPEPHTDFIFAIIAEEFGFLGSLLVIGLFVLLLLRGIKISNKSENYFYSLLAMGIVIYFSTQAAFHIGVSCGVFPTKGLTLPFISFGGSSLIVSLMASGLLLKISILSKTTK